MVYGMPILIRPEVDISLRSKTENAHGNKKTTRQAKRDTKAVCRNTFYNSQCERFHHIYNIHTD